MTLRLNVPKIDVTDFANRIGLLNHSQIPAGSRVYWGSTYDGVYDFSLVPPEDTAGWDGEPVYFQNSELQAEIERRQREKRPPPTVPNPPPPELIPDTSDAIAVCLGPDVCRSPDKPVPYQAWGRADDDAGYSPDVFSNGLRIKRADSRFTTTYGDEPGTGLGVKSNTVGDVVEPVTSSPIVRANGIPIERHGDRVTLNRGNTVGEYIHVQSTEIHLAPDGADEEDKAWYKKAWDDLYAGAEATSGTLQTGESLWKKAGEYWSDPSSIIRDVEGAYESLPTGAEIWEGTGNIARGVAYVSGEIWNDPRGSVETAGGWAVDQIGDAIDTAKQSYADHGAMGAIGAMGGLALDAANPFRKLKLAEKALEAADAAGDLAEAERLRDEVKRLRKEAEEAEKVKRGTSEDGGDGARSTRKPRISLRERYLGQTPGKNSRTGDKVRERMRKEKKLRKNDLGEDEFLDENGTWRPVDSPQTHMGHHPMDAVDYWNETGRFYGAKSKEVRAWMLDSENYQFEWGPLNSARGGATTSRYLPPAE